MIVPATLIGEVIYPGIRLLLFWVLVALNAGDASAVTALVISGVIAAVAGATWLHNRVLSYQPEAIGPLPKIAEVSHYIGPMVVARLINLAIVAGMPLLIGRVSSVVDVAQFGAASRLTMLVSVVIISVNAIFSPMISEYLAQGRVIALKAIYQQVAAFTFVVVSPVITVCVLLPGEIMAVFGTEFHDGAQYLRPLAIGQLIVVSLAAADQVALMRGSSKLLMFTTTLGTAMAIGLALVTVDAIGPIAFGFATAIGLAVAHLLVFFTVLRQLGLHPFGRDMLLANIVTWSVVSFGMLDIPTVWKLSALLFQMILVLGIGGRLLLATGLLASVKRRLGSVQT